MEQAMLKLRSGAVPAEQNGVPGLRLGDLARFAQSPGQAEILRALLCGGQAVDGLLGLLRALPGAPPDAENAPIALSAFILDFGDFLET